MTRPIRTRKDIVDKYCIFVKTVIYRLKKHGIIVEKGCISPAHYERIIIVLGNPEQE